MEPTREYYRRKSRIMKMKRSVAHARKRIRRFRILLKALLIFSLLYFSYFILNVRYWYFDNNKLAELDPEIVKIEGNIITPEYKIQNIIKSQKKFGGQIYKYSTKNLENELSKLQSVKRAYIRRFWFPARIIVFIQECTPVFVISPNVESMPVAAITKEGKYIDREYMPLPTKFQTTKILSYGINGFDYKNWDKNKVEEISRFIKTIEAYSKQKVQYVDLRIENDIYVQLEDVLLRIGSLDDTLEERIKSIPTILPEVKMLKQKVKYVDLRWNESSYIKLDTNRPTEESEDKEEEPTDL